MVVVRRLVLAATLSAVALLALPLTAQAKKVKPHRPVALLVGEFHGVKGQYATINEALKVAQEGDYILVGPGDYKQSSSETITGVKGDLEVGADVIVKTPNIHIRGMNRNEVMLDGTKPGTPECSSAESDRENFSSNGIVVYKASGVWLQNFSTCNFMVATRSGSTAAARAANRRSARGGANG